MAYQQAMEQNLVILFLVVEVVTKRKEIKIGKTLWILNSAITLMIKKTEGLKL